jgi:broad specificity phosphatase PhoE
VARDAAEAAGHASIDIAERDMDVPLSDRGMEQARALGTWLEALGADRPSVVVTSPYRRAAQTAEVAWSSSNIGVPLVVDERLRERDFGMLDRLTKRGITERFPEQAEARARVGKFYYRPPGGESWCDVALRVRSVLDTISREHPDERVLVVAHEVVILMFRYVLERLTEREILAIGSRSQLLNCAVTTYGFDPEPPGGMRLESFNAVEPLEAEQAPLTREPDVAAPR